MTDKVSPALVGKAGEMLVAAELMRKGIEIAHPASDVGVDLLAYRLQAKQKVATKFVPVQVKTRSETGYAFLRSWFDRCPGVALVHVWHVATVPEFYVFGCLRHVHDALGERINTPSWIERGIWTENKASIGAVQRMKDHRDRWDRIIAQLS